MTGRYLGKTALDRAPAAPSPDGVPVLLAVGNAACAGTPPRQRVIRIGAQGLAIGRVPAEAAQEAGGWFLPDRLVSSRHAELRRRGDGTICLVDHGSTNGTFVDGRRITGEEPLHEGALLTFGGHAAVFRTVAGTGLDAIAEEAGTPFGPVATASPALAVVCGKLRKLAPSRTEILLIGETGSGKEVYGRAVHAASGRQGGFMAINCAAIPRDLLESELFGYSRGAHSTAHRPKSGLLQEADGGTVLLDEIGDMPHELQAKLLRFLETREITPLGATRALKLDVRIVAATARGGEGRLREDLLARLGAEPIVLPPLRDRVEDVGALMAHFLGEPRPALTTRAFTALLTYRWPRNVRELQKVVETAQLLAADAAAIDVAHLPASILDPAPVAEPAAAPRFDSPKPVARRPAPTKEELEALLREHNGSVADVARALDRRWQVVWRWMKSHGLEAASFRRPKG